MLLIETMYTKTLQICIEVVKLLVNALYLSIKFSGAEALDYGGVQCDMYFSFWEIAYSKFFEGATLLVPMVYPHLDMTIFPIIRSHFVPWLPCRWSLPVRISLPTLINMLLGPKKSLLKFCWSHFSIILVVLKEECSRKPFPINKMTDFPLIFKRDS